MTRIFIVRHAEAEGNLFRRIHGHYDASVTYNGLRQIAVLRERFARETIDACYSSDLIRTKTTAQAVYLPKKLPLRCDARFRETNLGVWEDEPFGWLERTQPEAMHCFSHKPEQWRVEGGEDYLTYSSRFLEALHELALRHDGETIAIFSHGSAIRAALQRLFPTDETSVIGHCDNTGVSLIEFENGQYRCVFMNDNSHIPSEISTFARQNWWKNESGVDEHNLWFRPMRDSARYVSYRRDAWEMLHGPARNFDGASYFHDACIEAEDEPEALCDVMRGERVVGVVQLSIKRDATFGIGYIPFLYLIPELRNKGMGIQLVGHAVSVLRRHHKKLLRLSVSPRNDAALAFYKKYGFQEVGRAQGYRDDLIVMQYDLDPARYLTPEAN